MKTSILLLLILVAAGCATTNIPRYTIGVNSFAASDIDPSGTYALVPADPDRSDRDLQFIEFSQIVERVLDEHGLKRIADYSRADFMIFLDYGIGDPQTRAFTYSVPTWGQTGVASSTTTGQVNVYGNMGTYSQTTTNTPQYGVTGYQTRQGSVTSYTRHARLTAYDLSAYRETGSENIVWDTRMASAGSSGDLRLVFPVMIVAAQPYIATSTGRIIDVTLRENDSRVKAIMESQR